MTDDDWGPVYDAEKQAREDVMTCAGRANDAWIAQNLADLQFWNGETEGATKRMNLARQALVDQILNEEEVLKALSLLTAANAELANQAAKLKTDAEDLRAFAKATAKAAKLLALIVLL